ncbi:PREDICTED: endogenous retrovirus group K member 18 Pol protein-like [Calidris pugnax]|uniref:endogenous retrovirus group K member 18 Pol protein-like n=1 Tax=Calidris pugnax TaxID=198806 RepID=UPI00071DF3C3|nr:PREDICTED: endogenous retrovirus group K member 18 Pol protein-like [Calidris pugnax]
MGLFVLPGIIDADFTGEIKIMAWTPSPPCFVPKGQRIAQLVPLPSVTIPGEGNRKGGFGSTGKPVVLWSKQVSKEQPLLRCQVHDRHFSGLVDTGADVTIINISDWPPEWPLRDPTSAIVGVGGLQKPKQSAKILTFKGPEGQIAHAAPYILPVPCTLWGCALYIMGPRLVKPVGNLPENKFSIGAIDKQQTLSLTWKSEKTVWVDQWPLKKDKLLHLHDLVQEQLAAGHIVPTTSPWNTPVFVIPKKGGRWRLIHDLRAINAVIEPMGALQPGLPSPSMLPQNWPIAIIDLKDCFFAIPLHPKDAPRFAFSVPAVNQEQPTRRYHWTVLPQGMLNSPTICQLTVANALQPVRNANPHVIIYHYMDDILIAAEKDKDLQIVVCQVRLAVQGAGLQIAEEKVQREPPWKYLGWKITTHPIQPQALQLALQIKTLNDLQKLLGTINWLRPFLGITTQDLHPLFQLLPLTNRTLCI